MIKALPKNKLKKYDAIFVLGISANKKDYLPRVKIAVKLLKQGLASQVIFSGRCWGGLKKKPKITEAALMKKEALKLGISSHNIILENKSLNTAGNFYFTKKLILKPKKWFKLIVITQKNNILKAKYLAHKILGSLYKLSWITDGTSPNFSGHHTGLVYAQKFFASLQAGDDKAIASLISQHPHYKLYRNI